MNYFEDEIVKYERRLKRISESPKSDMLASNKLLYQAQLEHNKDQLKWWHDDRPFVAAGNAGTSMLMRCFGDFRPLNLVGIADRIGTKHAEVCFEAIRGMDLPDYACDRTILFLPMAIRQELPKILAVVSHSGYCQVGHDSYITLAHMIGVPVYAVDIPFRDPYQDHLDYITNQLRGMIDWAQQNLPSAKFDERRLIELQNQDKRWFETLHEIYRLRQTIPCPDHPQDVFRLPIRPHTFFGNPSLLLEYYESYRDELKSRINRGFSPVGDEKLRILWSITGPFGGKVWDYLISRGVSVPYWHFGGGPREYYMPFYGDTFEYGRKLSPLEEEARVMSYNSWGGGGERWIQDTIAACKQFRADGLVLFEQTGCMPVHGINQILAQKLEEELGIIAWRVEGRMLLGQTERTQNEFMAGLESFINRCFDRKRAN